MSNTSTNCISNELVAEYPLISFCIFSYNQEKYIREAVEGAFSQTYSPLEIILSDDCSSDRTFDIMKEMAAEYKGPHKIILNRNEHNMGLVPHFNEIMFKISRSDIIILGAGDDISLPERAQRSFEILSTLPDVVALSFDTLVIDSDSNVISDQINNESSNSEEITFFTVQDYLSKRKLLYKGCSRTIRRSLLNLFGVIPEEVQEEDAILSWRAILLGKNAYINDKMVLYRIHANNISKFLDTNLDAKHKIIEARKADLRIALNNGIITVQLANKLEKFLDDHCNVCDLSYRYFRSPSPLLYHFNMPLTRALRAHVLFMFHLLFSPRILFSTKFRLFKRYFSLSSWIKFMKKRK